MADSPAPKILLLAAVLLLAIGVCVVAPAASMGFVSLDYLHLSKDQDRQWFASYDHLYRPLRNGMFRVLPHVFGSSPAPYRIMTWIAYALCGLLFYRLLRRLDLSQTASLLAAGFAWFFPRNHELLFWWSTVQDVFAVSFVLAMLLCWIEYRQRRRRWFLVASVACWALALGFKETAIVAPGLALLTDLYRPQEDVSVRSVRFWRPYAGFALPAALLGAFLLLYSDGIFLAEDMRQARTYDLGSLTGIAFAELRAGMNLIVPFGPMLWFRELRAEGWVIVGASALLLALFFWRSAHKRIWLFGAAWALLALLPTSTFAASVPADHYLYLASFGLAASIGSELADMRKSQGWPGAAAVGLAVGAYLLAGSYQLIRYREEALASAASLQRAVEQIRQAAPAAVPLEIELANVSVAFRGGAGVWYGALVWDGYPRTISVSINLESPDDPAQRELQDRLRACTRSATDAGWHALLMENGAFTDRTGTCARAVIVADREARPRKWR